LALRPPSRSRLIGLHNMDWANYLRDEAARYRQLAEQTDDPVIINEMLELLALDRVQLLPAEYVVECVEATLSQRQVVCTECGCAIEQDPKSPFVFT